MSNNLLSVFHHCFFISLCFLSVTGLEKIKKECSCKAVKIPASKIETLGFCGHELNKMNKNKACENNKFFDCSIENGKMTISVPYEETSCSKSENCVKDPEDEFRRVCMHPKGRTYSRMDCKCPKDVPSNMKESASEISYHDGKQSIQYCGKELNEKNSNHACGDQDHIICHLPTEMPGLTMGAYKECKNCSPDPKKKKYGRICL